MIFYQRAIWKLIHKLTLYYLPSFDINICTTSVPTTQIHDAPAQVGVRPVSHSAISPLAVVSKDGPERVGP